MMSSPQSLNENGKRRRSGRWQLVMLLVLVIGPMVLASAMYYGRFWIPDGRNYHGELIGGSVSLAELGVPADTEKSWQLLVSAPEECVEECQQMG